MKTLPSIQKRLSLFLVVLSVGWGLSISATIWAVGRNQVDKMLDYTLLEAAEILYGLLTFDVAQLPMQGAPTMPTPYVHDERLVWQVVEPDGRVSLQSHRAPASPLTTVRRLGYFDAEADWRVFGMPLRDESRMLYVAHFDIDRQEVNLAAIQTTALAVLLSALVCAYLLRRQVRTELAPLNELSVAVARYDPLQRDARLAEPLRMELVTLRTAVVDFGARLAKRVANERAFTAHAAHALRTPLAGMDAQLAAAIRECAPAQQARLRRTREAASRLRSVVTALLTLFRSGVDLNRERFDLKSMVALLPIDGMAVSVRRNATLNADLDLLAAALLNLLDNSLRQGARHVMVDVVEQTGGVCIRLRDDGPGMPPDQARIIRDALERQDYQGHMGLGLMLADLIARAHGGRLVLGDTTAGVTVEIHLPAEAVADVSSAAPVSG